MIMMPVTKAIMEPTDRSKPPEEMTKVAPTAMIAMKALRVTTLIRLADDTKLEFTNAPNSTTYTCGRPPRTSRIASPIAPMSAAMFSVFATQSSATIPHSSGRG